MSKRKQITMRIKASKKKKITMRIKISKRKKTTCLTFYAFYAFYAFYSLYSFCPCEITLITSFTILLLYHDNPTVESVRHLCEGVYFKR